MTVAEPVPASSVVALRSDPELRVLMVRRAQRSRSWAGLWVFPGGRIEAGESARHAALRELFEETGILLGASVFDAASGSSVQTRAELARARGSLNSGAVTFEQVLACLGASVEPDRLMAWARWVTPSAEERRFDAQFFVCDLSGAYPGMLDGASSDDLETIDSSWMVPASVLKDYRDGRLSLAPPTLRILEELRTCESAEVCLERAAHRPKVTILPRFLPDRSMILLPWDPQYAGTEVEGVKWPSQLGSAEFGPSRFVRGETGWLSEDG